MIKSRYPDYDVMARAEEWDPSTSQVIRERMKPPAAPQFFTEAEAGTLTAACSRLLGESDAWLLAKVLEHIDSSLAPGKGEGFRPESQPPDDQFWRAGIAALGPDFATRTAEEQDQQLRARQGEPFFKALLKEAVSGYCSLPPVWSFMGYGGPAFPRGYVRIELGLRDPWEAKQHVE